MAIPLPGGPEPDPGRRQKFDALARAILGLGGKSVELRFGTGTVTWPGGNPFTSTVTIPHGLGRAAVVALATAALPPGSANATVSVVSKDATNVVWQGCVADTVSGSPAAATTRTFYWIAIG